MENNRKKANTFLKLFVPEFRNEAMRIVRDCDQVSEATKSTNPRDLVKLEFKFKPGMKWKVYQHFVWVIANKYLSVSQSELIAYLAENTNLASNENIKTRKDTIKRALNRRKNIYHQ